MTYEQNTPPEAIVEAEEPPRRARRYLGQTPRALLEEGLIVAITGLILGWGYSQLPQVPPARLPLSYALLAMLAMLGGMLLAYTVQSYQIRDLRLHTTELLDLSRRSIDDGRWLVASMRTMIEDTYTIGHQEGRAPVLAFAVEAEARINELERELAERQQYPAAGPDLRKLAAQVDDLRRTVEEILAADPGQDEELAELQAGIADINAKADALAAEIARQDQRRPVKIDPMDDWILALLNTTPQPTDEEIGKKVGLSASQVLRRRNKLAAAGYAAAQKRQGQRPRTR